jgi:hypothetical protein
MRVGQNEFEVKVYWNVYAVDSTTIDLCLTVFWWATFRKYGLPDPFCMNLNFQHHNICTSIFIELLRIFGNTLR